MINFRFWQKPNDYVKNSGLAEFTLDAIFFLKDFLIKL